MNIFLMPLLQLATMAEGAGGLFDFNATLPLMALQFVLLTTVLTFIFYKPIAKVLEDRETYISKNLSDAADKLVKADGFYRQYDEQLTTARIEAQAIIAKSKDEAKEVVNAEINQACQDATSLIQQTNKELEAQKSLALQKLETQIGELSELIKEKLLSTQIIL